MATLIRERAPASESRTITNVESELHANVPAPFPKDLVQKILNDPVIDGDVSNANVSEIAGPSSYTPTRPTLRISQIETTTNQEVGPSMTHVQQSCLMTLNNLLSQDAQEWLPIVPTRRHSLPAQSPTSPTSNVQTLLVTPTSTSALQTLVTNLRYRDDLEMREIAAGDDASLLRELDARITALVHNGSIEPRDAHLAGALASLLTHLNRLSVISPESSHRSPVEAPQPPSVNDIYDTLRLQVSEFQSRRDASLELEPSSSGNQAPVQVIEHALLWSQIDDDLDEVSRLCRERTETVLQHFNPITSSLPPEYDLVDNEPPRYDPTEYSEAAAVKASHKSRDSSLHSPPTQSHNNTDEKMRLDLEAVTMAIERLYLVAPQLSNQRVELKRTKLEQMEHARTNGSHSRGTGSRRGDKGKEVLRIVRERGATVTGGRVKDQDVRELDKILELINKASTRRIDDQSVILNGQGEMAERLERARLREQEKRDAFHERLVTHANTRRLISQDATLNTSAVTSLGIKTKNPDALLTLPEFIREAVPDSVEQARDPEALLTLPEFVREQPPAPPAEPALNNVTASASKLIKKPFKPSRTRSLSAPPFSLAWLIAGPTSIIRTPSPLAVTKTDETSESKQHVNDPSTSMRAGLEVQYVAEYQEYLHCVAVFFQVSGKQAGIDIEAETVPSGGERLIVKCGASTSPPLSLPARVLPGKQDVKVQSGHLEVKIDCSSQENSQPMQCGNDTPGAGLLDATQLRALNPTSFICASCSLPIIQSSRLSKYDDLPSEYWAELLESWMCHADQKINDRVAHYADGLYPVQGQALVGGSYMLFDASSVVTSNIRPCEPSKVERPEDWSPVRCICGAVIGRSRERAIPFAPTATTYRFAKYAIRPVSPSSDPLKIPLSAFILGDMDELVHAHATYRFVISDEEDEKPRILLWMFKPHMRLSYATSNHYFIARSASIQAAKVHFKILGPSVSPTLKSTVEKYPGFAQSERLLYPLDVCRRLAGLLKESNAVYPQGRRVMGGLDVGWLLRV